MYKTTLKCSCGASYKVKASPEEYKDTSYAIRQQVDNWMITHQECTPVPPKAPIPPINENPLGLWDSEPL